jgi:hypothetical protein
MIPPMGAVRAPWSSASFLHYTGALIVLVASIGLLSSLSDDYGKAAFVGWSLLVLVIVALLAAGYERAGMRTVAGLFGFVTLAVFIVFVGALEVWIHLLGTDDEPISGFHIGLLILYAVAFVAALVNIARFHFPLPVVVVAAATWLFIVDLISNGGTWSAIVSIFVGFFLLLTGAAVDRTYGFWLHIAAGLAMGGAFLYVWHSSWWEWVLIGITALVFFLFAAALDRSSYAVLGTIGLFLVASHFIEDWVGSSVDPFDFIFGEGGPASHPWARAILYAVFGIILVGIGFWFERRRPPAAASADRPAS